MAFDSLVTAKIAANLNQTLTEARVMKVFQPDRHTILLKLHHPTGGKQQLLLSCHPQSCRLHLTSTTYENPPHPAMFCMLLRKYLEGSRIKSFRQIGTDRLVEITFAATSEIGDPLQLALYLEIMGKHSNLILVNLSTKLIIDSLKRVSHQTSRLREILPGLAYTLPPQQNKIPISTLREEDFQQLCLAQDMEMPIYKILYQSIAGISPLSAKLILDQCNLSEDLSIDEMGTYEYGKIWQELVQLSTAKSQNTLVPIFVHDNAKGSRDYTVYHLNISSDSHNYTIEKTTDINKLLDDFFSEKEQTDVLSGRKRELLKIISSHIARVEKKLQIQQADLTDAYAGELYKEKGELITAYIYQIEKGMTEIILPSFYRENEQVTIALQPDLTPAENSRYYFKKYNKAKISQQQLEQQVSQNQGELDYLNSVYAMLEQCETLTEIAAVKEELQQENYLKTKNSKLKQANKKQDDSLPPRRFLSSAGFEILVGRNNKQNDQLTLKIARKDDIWLHTKDIPGSHVIIRNPDHRQEIPEDTLLFAAGLAAYYSKARSSSQVPVDYTLVQYVKKPSGAKPGKVIFTNQKTLYITPETPKADQE
ncbi:MAG: fibronectin-binding domain-containing protein [Peptococcaceae bacterium]|nr:fibronectin-binding domain-containing protein [Peptococcaceae bacterium]